MTSKKKSSAKTVEKNKNTSDTNATGKEVISMNEGQADAALKLHGDCTIYEIADLKETLVEYFNDSEQLDVDLAAVEKVDASFMQLLMSLKKSAEAAEKELSFINVSKDLAEVVELMQLNMPVRGKAV